VLVTWRYATFISKNFTFIILCYNLFYGIFRFSNNISSPLFISRPNCQGECVVVRDDATTFATSTLSVVNSLSAIDADEEVVLMSFDSEQEEIIPGDFTPEQIASGNIPLDNTGDIVIEEPKDVPTAAPVIVNIVYDKNKKNGEKDKKKKQKGETTTGAPVVVPTAAPATAAPVASTAAPATSYQVPQSGVNFDAASGLCSTHWYVTFTCLCFVL